MIQRKIEVNKSLLNAFENTPTPIGVIGLFYNSYVQFDPNRLENNYRVKENDIYISNDPGSPDVPLFHELSHFVLAKDNRLHKTNYGYQFPYTHHTRWDDLNCEIQVSALESNLLDYYKIKSENKRGEEAQIWSFLTGWDNYRKTHKLGKKEMIKKAQSRFEYWKKVHTARFFFEEWKRKNDLLKTRFKRNGTIVPR